MTIAAPVAVHVEMALGYARDVAAGEIAACKWVRLACERQLKDLERQSEVDWPYWFSEGAAERVCQFVERMPHIKGRWAGTTIVLEPWQCFVLSVVFGWLRQDTGARRFRTVYIEVPRKNAKALALDTPIPTPAGWLTMGDIEPGDEVFDENGQPCTVVAATPVMVDHDCYEVEFSDGTKIVADAGHLWQTRARRTGRPGGAGLKGLKRSEWFGTGGGIGLRTTEEIAKTLVTGGPHNERNHSVQVAGPLDLPDIDLPVPPYVLGAWLGDGTSASATLTCSYQDGEILERIRSAGVSVKERLSSNAGSGLYVLGSNGRSAAARKASLQALLRQMGLLGDKHVPAIYQRGSIEQRMELLRGLMDTDGTISPAGQCSFTTTREALADGMVELLAGLGFKPSARERRAMLDGRDCGPAFDIQFWAFSEQPVFGLTRKRDRQKQIPAGRARSTTRQIVACRPVDSVPVRCIQVSASSGMYLAGRTMIPTHNSTLTAAVGLYMLTADGEGGAEVYSAAKVKDQAHIVFDIAHAMARKSPQFREYYGVEANGMKPPLSLTVVETSSRYVPLSSEDKNLDGLNVHFGGIDELHAHPTRDVFDVIETGMGARTQPLLWCITTAGSNRAGICYEQRTYVTKILEGVARDETYFGVVYTIDDGDPPLDPATWAKANPNLGVSVFEDQLERLAAKAREMPAAMNNFLTKHLDSWVNADEAWMDMSKWDKCADRSLRIEDFKGERCMVAVDLASRIDIAAMAVMFRRDEHYYAFARYWLPEETIEQSGNSQYSGWVRDGRLRATDGNIIDFELIENDLDALGKEHQVVEVAFDPFQATEFSTRMMAKGFPMVEMRATVLNFSEPMKRLDALVRDGKFHHDGDPAMGWMISNVVAHYDQKDNIYPRKERRENKIDGPITLIMALGRWTVQGEPVASVYETRGVRTI